MAHHTAAGELASNGDITIAALVQTLSMLHVNAAFGNEGATV
jgi:hypothetical protein